MPSDSVTYQSQTCCRLDVHRLGFAAGILAISLNAAAAIAFPVTKAILNETPPPGKILPIVALHVLLVLLGCGVVLGNRFYSVFMYAPYILVEAILLTTFMVLDVVTAMQDLAAFSKPHITNGPPDQELYEMQTHAAVLVLVLLIRVFLWLVILRDAWYLWCLKSQTRKVHAEQ